MNNWSASGLLSSHPILIATLASAVLSHGVVNEDVGSVRRKKPGSVFRFKSEWKLNEAEQNEWQVNV